MKALPAAAAVTVVAVVALLLLTDGGDERRPGPGPTTTTSAPPVSPQLRWAVLSGSANERRSFSDTAAILGFEATSAYDLERDRSVAVLRRVGPGPGRARLQDESTAVEAGRRTFSASLRVTGPGRAWLLVEAYVLALADRGQRGRPVAVVSSEAEPVTAGGWQRRSVSFDAPDPVSLVRFAVVFDGEGEVAVDDVVDP